MHKTRSKISAFIVAGNESEHIRACVESVAFCDEVLVIDSFSTDDTVALARQAGAHVLQRAWDGYRAQKAFGLTQVAHRWVLNLDADERVTPELRSAIETVLERDAAGDSVADGYFINRVVFYLNRWWRTGGWYPEYRLRFFKKDKATWGGREPHEKVEIDGRTERLDGELQHFTYRDLDDQLTRLRKFAMISAEDAYSRGKPFKLHSLIFNPIMRTLKFFFLKRGYREGVAGFIIAVLEGYYTFMKYARLWELHTFGKHNEQKSK